MGKRPSSLKHHWNVPAIFGRMDPFGAAVKVGLRKPVPAPSVSSNLEQDYADALAVERTLFDGDCGTQDAPYVQPACLRFRTLFSDEEGGRRNHLLGTV